MVRDGCGVNVVCHNARQLLRGRQPSLCSAFMILVPTYTRGGYNYHHQVNRKTIPQLNPNPSSHPPFEFSPKPNFNNTKTPQHTPDQDAPPKPQLLAFYHAVCTDDERNLRCLILTPVNLLNVKQNQGGGAEEILRPDIVPDRHRHQIGTGSESGSALSHSRCSDVLGRLDEIRQTDRVGGAGGSGGLGGIRARWTGQGRGMGSGLGWKGRDGGRWRGE